MFKSVLACTLAPSVGSLVDDVHWPAFQEFIDKYARKYQTESEVADRFAIFKESLKRIDERNAKGGSTHGITKFADLSPEEFASKYMGRLPLESTTLPLTNRTFPHTKEGSSSIDWCDVGHCTPVKDQGQCGSCWAFGGVECLESAFSIDFGELYDLSTMQVTACDPFDGGCAGGNAINSWAYANSVGGIEPASVWEYNITTPMTTPTCIDSKVIPAEFKVSTDSYFWISGGPYALDEDNMVAALQEITLSVAVAGGYWQDYTGGVVKAGEGCGTALNHNVQVTGYNEEGNYYIVRNSWGTGWGEAGFIYVEKGENVCGIAMETSGVQPTSAATSLAV